MATGKSSSVREGVGISWDIWRCGYTIKSFAASSFSCSMNNLRADSKLTSSKRISSRGRSWPRLLKSAEMTLAIFAYPPVVCCYEQKNGESSCGDLNGSQRNALADHFAVCTFANR